ncbi:MAG: WG repeat-containing protein [Bacteroidota bacterium]
MRRFIFILLVLAPNLVLAQGYQSKKAFNLLTKQKYDKVIDLLDKSLAKDTINPGARYIYSLLLLEKGFKDADLDRAYNAIVASSVDYSLLSPEDRSKLSKIGVDSLSILEQRQKVDSLAFERASAQHSIASYNYFINTFSGAIQIPAAIKKRNAIAFEQAKRRNTFDGYKSFMETYPEASEYQEARERYERLYFEESTKDKRLESYVRFLKKHPDTPYRDIAEKNIFEIAVGNNQIDSYLSFIKAYPNSHLKEKAVNYLYHTYKATNKAADFYPSLLSDSLIQVVRLEDQPLVPFVEAGEYGFMDYQAKPIIPAQYKSISTDYLCGFTSADYLLIQGDSPKIVGRNGATIWAGKYDDAEDIGYGFLKVKKGDYYGLVHKSSYKVLPPKYDDIKVVDGQFLAHRLNGKWGLVSFHGRQISAHQFQDIDEVDGYLVFRKSDKIALITAEQVAEQLNGASYNLAFKYEELEVQNDGLIITINGEKEALLGKNYHYAIPPDKQTIRPLSKGYLVERDDDYLVLNDKHEDLNGISFKSALYNDNWVTLKKDSLWGAFHLDAALFIPFEYDSISLLGNHLLRATKNDSSWFYFPASTDTIPAGKDQAFRIIESNISTGTPSKGGQYLCFEDGDQKQLYNYLGIQIFEGKADAISAVGEEYIIIERKGKKTLMDADGQKLLSKNIEAVGNYKAGIISILYRKKFGLFSVKDTVNIPCEYEKILTPYNRHTFIASKGGKQGLIDKNNVSLTGFEFEEIRYWNDTAALIKKDFQWILYDFKQNKNLIDEIKDIELYQSESEITATYFRENKYGLISNTRGEVVPPTYTVIHNLGSIESPIYFAEKYIEEAEFHVVIYYDSDGNILRKDAFEAQDYSRIYCDD